MDMFLVDGFPRSMEQAFLHRIDMFDLSLRAGLTKIRSAEVGL